MLKMKLFVTLIFTLFTVCLYGQEYNSYDNNSKLYVGNLAVSMDGGGVIVSWRGVKISGLRYYVYRHNEPIVNNFVMSRATLISIVDATSFGSNYSIKDIPPKNGIYYYAIASVFNNSQIIFSGNPGTDMTTTAIELNSDNKYKYNLASQFNDAGVIELKYARQSSGNNVLYWQDSASYGGEYLIYKSSSPIEDIRDLSRARLVGKTRNSFFVDSLSTDEYAYYYVVTDDKRKRDIYSYNNVQMSQSATTNQETVIPQGIRNLSIINDTSRLLVNWKNPYGSDSRYSFVLVTSLTPFKSEMNVFDNQGILDIINIESSAISFISDSAKYVFVPRKRDYVNTFVYYALIAVDSSASLDSYKLYDGMYTKYPVRISTIQPIDSKRIIPPSTTSGNSAPTGLQVMDGTPISSSYQQQRIPVITAMNTNNKVISPPLKQVVNSNVTTNLPAANLYSYGRDPTVDLNFIDLLNSIPEELYLPPVDILSMDGDYKIYYNSPQINDNIANDGLGAPPQRGKPSNGLFITNSNGDVLYLDPNNFYSDDDNEAQRRAYDNSMVKKSPDDIIRAFNPSDVNQDLKKTYDIYDTYNRARKLYMSGNYSECAKLLESVYSFDRDVDAYCKINILLGRSYYKLKNRNKALNAFSRVSKYRQEEASFWIRQVITDL